MSYRNDFREIQREAYWSLPRILFFVVILAIGLSVAGLVLKPLIWADKITENAIVNYEEFQEIYNTTQKLNQDLCTMSKLPDTDKMFKDFSKTERLNSIRLNLNRWIAEYNAKSKMITRNLWKSSSLPYQLQTSDFSCY